MLTNKAEKAIGIMKQLNLSHEVTAVYEEFPNGSEVNLFRHNHFLGRRWFPLTGEALQQQLERMVHLQNQIFATS